MNRFIVPGALLLDLRTWHLYEVVWTLAAYQLHGSKQYDVKIVNLATMEHDVWTYNPSEAQTFVYVGG